MSDDLREEDLPKVYVLEESSRNHNKIFGVYHTKEEAEAAKVLAKAKFSTQFHVNPFEIGKDYGHW